jgi:hypothetical protein
MKNIIFIVAFFVAITASAQTKVDQERMSRDLAIAENALGTIIKQQFDKRSMWFDIKSAYTSGFGVTMRLPNDNNNLWSVDTYSYGYNVRGGNGTAYIAPPAPNGVGGVMVYDARGSNNNDNDNNDSDRPLKAKEPKEDREKLKRKQIALSDSARSAYYNAMIKASKDFLADYGDLISQLPAEEKILITNRGEGGRYYNYSWGADGKNQKRQLVTIEATKGDISSFRQGKITREQMLAKIKVVNTESTNEVETDLELFSSIIGRLYRSDLSKTFYSDDNIYYERLKEFGVIYYMTAYSGVEQNRTPEDKTEGRLWRMPTQRLEGLTQEQRNKKVIEIYPQFEKELKENIVEYAQTVKSLKDDEMIVFNVQVTKCVGCNIPSTLELTLKNGLVRKLAAGQTSKAEVVNAINVKKGVAQ